ncbi:MAG: Hexuronate transporter [Bryobacterales bacterium]|nr:Hexuronate transporter [Bryobacterales bacterium]
MRWFVCALLFFATSINYLDRQVLGILAPSLQHDIGWSEQQYGYIISAFQIAYAIGLVAAGRMVDRLGTRIGYAVIMGVWSLASMAHALANSALGFGIARFILGLGESGNFPAAIKTTAEWFPQSERSLATGIFNSGANLGAILAPALIPIITLRYGWRAAFLSTGVFGIAWMIWWLARFRVPGENKRLGAAEYEYIHRDLPPPTARIPWKRLLSYRQTWAFSIAKFLTDPIWWFYLYWLPKFFDSRFHLGLSHLGIPLIIIYNFSAVGSIGGGWLPAFFHRRGFGIVKARYAAMFIAACLVLPIFFVGQLSSQWAAIVILGVATAAHQGWSANLYTTVSDMFPKEAVGVVIGLGGMAGSVGGVLFSLSVGYLLELTHNYTILFAISASVYLVAFLLLRLLVPKLSRIDLAV